MTTQLSENYKLLILLKFTKELIRNSKSADTLELEKKLILMREIEKKRKPIVNSLQNIQTPKSISLQKRNLNSAQQFYAQNPAQGSSQSTLSPQQRTRESPQQRLIIPDVNLPERFQYLKPVPTKEEIDLGKLNPLIRNPQVKEIECDGPNTEIIVKAPMPKITQIILTEEEIQDIFLAFSKSAMIPIEENIVKIAAGNLILNGINSKVIGSKFVIRKMAIGFGR